jgi:hypothetical protein
MAPSLGAVSPSEGSKLGLSVWQVKRQLAYLAAQAAWADTPQGLVYSGGGVVSEDLDGNFRLGAAQIDGPLPLGGADNAAGLAPFCRVQCLGTEWDHRSNSPRIERVRLRMWSTAGGGAIPGSPTQAGFDSHGINQVTGVNRAAVDPLGKSQGRDVDELIGRFSELYSQFIDTQHGFQGRCSVTDRMVKVNGSLVLKRALDVEVLNALLANYYHPVRGLVVVSGGGGAGSITASWTEPPRRFDSFQYVIRYSNPGGAPPATITAGNSGGTAAIGSTSKIITGLNSGSFYGISVFCAYDEAGAQSSNERASTVTSASVAAL